MQTLVLFNVDCLVRHNRTWQGTISCCRKSDWNMLSGRNRSVLCYSVHPSSGQQRHIPAGQR